jgi:hypothetical protein
MQKENVFQIMEFVEDIKDRLNNIEYINIMDILKSSYKVSENGRNLYNVTFSITQVLEINKTGEVKDISFNIINSTCLVRLKNEEYEILKGISLKEQLNTNKEDLENIYTILYLINNINFFNIYEMNINVIEDIKKISYILEPKILNVNKAKNIDGDLYNFSFSYRYYKDENGSQEDSELEIYEDYYLNVSISKHVNREDFLFIESHINDMGFKLLIENYEDISFRIENNEGEIIKTEDELFSTIKFSYIEYKPYIEYNEERYYLCILDFKYS